MEKLFEEALETIENLCENYEARIRNSREGELFMKWANGIRSVIGEKEADAFLAVAASGILSEDLIREAVCFEMYGRHWEAVEGNYANLMDGKPLHMTVKVTYNDLDWVDYEDARICEETERYEYALKSEDMDRSAAWMWERIRREKEEKKKKEERKAKLRSLVDEIGDARTGDERFNALAAIVREMVQEEDGCDEDYDDYDDYDDD